MLIGTGFVLIFLHLIPHYIVLNAVYPDIFALESFGCARKCVGLRLKKEAILSKDVMRQLNGLWRRRRPQRTYKLNIIVAMFRGERKLP